MFFVIPSFFYFSLSLICRFFLLFFLSLYILSHLRSNMSPTRKYCSRTSLFSFRSFYRDPLALRIPIVLDLLPFHIIFIFFFIFSCLCYLYVCFHLISIFIFILSLFFPLSELHLYLNLPLFVFVFIVAFSYSLAVFSTFIEEPLFLPNRFYFSN